MKVHFLDNKINLDTGGSSKSLDLLSRILISRGHEVTITTLNIENNNNYPDDRGYSVKNIQYSGQIDAAQAVIKTLRRYEHDTDIYHLYNPAYIPFGGIYRKSGGKTPVVGRLNNYSMFCTNRHKMSNECYKNCGISEKFSHDSADLQTKITRLPNYTFQSTIQNRLSSNVDRIFALSPSVKEIYTDYGINESTIDIVPNFFDPSFGPDGKVSRNKGEETLRLLYVGRLVPQKGIDILINAVSELGYEVTVDIIGDGPTREELEEHAILNNVEDRINFVGWVEHDNLGQYYNKSDIFIHPGRWPEPFNRTLLEAMQYGLPLIVSDVGGPPWVVDDAGLIFEPDNPQELARCISEFKSNSGLLNDKQAQVSSRLERFSPEKISSIIESKYNDICQ